jgi:hypothetical protein
VEASSQPAPPGVAPQELAPYDWEDFVVWAFFRSVRIDFSVDAAAIEKSLANADAKGAFALGLFEGIYEGGKEAVEQYAKDTTDLLLGVINYTLVFYTTVYDARLFAPMLEVLRSDPSSPQRQQALADLAELYRIEHPAASEALRALATADACIRDLLAALQQRAFQRKMLESLLGEMGEALTDAWQRIRNLTGQPEKQGEAVGKAVGDFVMQVALFFLGF